MALYASAAPVFNLYRDTDGVFVCEMTPGMIQELQGLLDDAIAAAHQKGQWVPAPCVALTRRLENAARRLGGCDAGPDRPTPTPR